MGKEDKREFDLVLFKDDVVEKEAKTVPNENNITDDGGEQGRRVIFKIVD